MQEQIDVLTDRIAQLERTVRALNQELDSFRRSFTERQTREAWPWYKRVYRVIIKGL